jgi:hypothetical protein
MINDSIVILGDEKNLLALASGTVVSHLKKPKYGKLGMFTWCQGSPLT